MIHFGIIGAENSHSWNIAKLCNIDKKLPGVRANCIWGETAKFAKHAAAEGQIPTIVKDWHDMLGKVDGVMIDHRHAGPHFEVAKFFIENKVPTFIDKPMTYRLREAKILCDLAEKNNTPMTTFSVLVTHKSLADFKKKMKVVGDISHFVTTGPVTLKNKWGGIFFYGIHQVDVIIDVLGIDIYRVNFTKDAQGGGVATLQYKHGPIVTMNCVNNGCYTFAWTVAGNKGVYHAEHQADASSYQTGAKIFTKMFKTGKSPIERRRMIAPVAVLEALEKSMTQGKPVNVAKF